MGVQSQLDVSLSRYMQIDKSFLSLEFVVVSQRLFAVENQSTGVG